MHTAAADLALTIADVHAQTDGFPIFAALKGTALALLVLWTIAANTLVFIVLYKNPRLQTVPNLLVNFKIFVDFIYCFYSRLEIWHSAICVWD